ncbi:hypothetical protein P8452_59624 [Trifolium repens]|nr:hypothetical protein P8452_59624 [Trifolium repens]
MAKMHSFNDFIPTFHNLAYLHLSFLNYRWHFLVEVLKHCPNLQELDIDEAGAYATEETWTRKDDKENWMDPDSVPQCLSLHLKNCQLMSFLGLQEEVLYSCPRASSTCELMVYDDSFDNTSDDASLEAREGSFDGSDD